MSKRLGGIKGCKYTKPLHTACDCRSACISKNDWTIEPLNEGPRLQWKQKDENETKHPDMTIELYGIFLQSGTLSPICCTSRLNSFHISILVLVKQVDWLIIRKLSAQSIIYSGLLPDVMILWYYNIVILFTLCDYIIIGEPLPCYIMKNFWVYSQRSHLNLLACLEGLDVWVLDAQKI